MPAFAQHIFVTGIGTGVGKTIVSAVLAEALHADYWKPVQCGGLDNSDSHIVASLTNEQTSRVHPELYRFKTASSPHYAAQIEGVQIDLAKFNIPETKRRLIIEGAGGMLVPLNDHNLVIDLIKHLRVPVILVARNYLGSINHTLLSIAALNGKGIEIAGIIYSGTEFLDNEAIIQKLTHVPVLGRIEEAADIDKPFVEQQAMNLRKTLAQYFEV